MITVDKIIIINSGDETTQKRERWTKALEDLPLKAPYQIWQWPIENNTREEMTNGSIALLSTWASSVGAEMNMTEIRQAFAHYNLWKALKGETFTNVLVLEEDFQPAARHYHVLDTTETWDLIYLGRKSFSVDTPLSGGIVKPGYSHGFAYLINKNGIEKLLESNFAKQLIPFPDFLSIMHNAFPRPEIAKAFSGRIKALALMKDLIGQQSFESTLSADAYQPLHSQLFNAFGNATPAWVRKYINPQLIDREFDLICDEPIDNVYSFPLFTPLFCKEIIEEAEHYGKWTNYRYKDHPSIDIMLSSFGFNEIYSWVLKEYLYPLLYHKYQLQNNSLKTLVSQNFIVRYLAEQQQHLGVHNDGCHISMVVSLNTTFEGGGTFFPKFKKLIRHDQPGYASIHPGFVGYLHGARPIIAGKRYIIASFFFLES